MNEKKKIYILIGIFILFFLVLLMQFTPKKSNNKVDSKYLFEENSNIIITMANINKKENFFFDELIELTRKTNFKRDPFDRKAIKVKVTSKQKYVLQGIFWDEGKAPSAVINDQNVNIGSRINTAIVLDIQKDRVILRDSEPEDPASDGFLELIFHFEL